MVEDKTDKVSVSLVAKADGAAPNEEVDVLVKLRMHDGWHTYWANPGDAGLATNIRWRLPEGYRSSDVWLSKPDRFLFEELVQYGYGDTAYLKTSLIPEKTGNSKKNPGRKNVFGNGFVACLPGCLCSRIRKVGFFPCPPIRMTMPDGSGKRNLTRRCRHSQWLTIGSPIIPFPAADF